MRVIAFVDLRLRLAQRAAGRQIERYRRGGEQPLVIDAERRVPWRVMREGGQGNHRLDGARDRRARRGARVAARGERVGRKVARRVGGDRRGRALRACGGLIEAGCDAGLLGPARIRAGGRDVEIAERAGVLPVLRSDLHDDMVLILRAVDDGDLALAERVVQRVVDGVQRQAKPLRGIAVDDDVGLETSPAAGRSSRP